ncbi:hypothetical protein SeMB42_g02017 [Synchytrium endobioticum]|uniref:PLAT domain-containing protein n=1 Tax=Synchytrium endobioticum TaxID=286115 RepID=A0A507DHI0_9FUNG|nr:hypothetical protein SeLEV6574_g02302 [Synchytrium endobioticum]TPX51149.1 hypothetical protein SeMB42_g02017 [Synchytrium endobioticum]
MTLAPPQMIFYGYNAAAAGIVGAITASYCIGVPLMILRDSDNKPGKPSGLACKLAPSLFEIRISTSTKSAGPPPPCCYIELDGSRGSSGLIRLDLPKFVAAGFTQFLIAAPPVGELVGVRLESKSQSAWLPDKITVAEVGAKRMMAQFNGGNWFPDGADASTHFQYLTVAQKSSEDLSFRTVFWYTLRDEHSVVSVAYPPAGASRLQRWCAVFTGLYIQLAVIVALTEHGFDSGVSGHGYSVGVSVLALLVGQFASWLFGVVFRRVGHAAVGLSGSGSQTPLRGPEAAGAADGRAPRTCVTQGFMLPYRASSMVWFLMLVVSFLSGFSALIDGDDLPTDVYAVSVGYWFLALVLRMAVTEMIYCTLVAWLRTRHHLHHHFILSSSLPADDTSLEAGLLRNPSGPGIGGNKALLFKGVDSGPGTPQEPFILSPDAVQASIKLEMHEVKDFSAPDFLADEDLDEDEEDD